jgi:MFS family permease
VGASAYGRLLRTRGAARLAASSVMLGIAGTMTPVSFVLFARSATHSFAGASLVLAASTTGGLLLAPVRGRLVDRVGPSAAILRLALPSVATDIAFILAGHARAGVAVLVVLAFLAGAITAPASAALRSVWSQVLADNDSRKAGYALMTMMQEATFIAGPLLAGGLIALWSPTAAVATAATLSLIGAIAFATSHGARTRGPQPNERGHLRALSGPGIRTVVATAAAFGLTFGALDVAFPAFARDHGSAATAGVLLSALAAGIGVGGFLYGLRQASTPPGRQYPALTLLAAGGLAPLIAAPSLPAMLPLAFLSGLCFAPITTCQIAVIDHVSETGHTAEAFTWLGTLYGAGSALGAALAGQLIAITNTRTAIGLACVATLAAWLLTAARANTPQTAARSGAT